MCSQRGGAAVLQCVVRGGGAAALQCVVRGRGCCSTVVMLRSQRGGAAVLQCVVRWGGACCSTVCSQRGGAAVLPCVVRRGGAAVLYHTDCVIAGHCCRMYLLEAMPSSLPKLLNAVKWSQHKDVALVRCCTVSKANGFGLFDVFEKRELVIEIGW